jgi:hypothetical protein
MDLRQGSISTKSGALKAVEGVLSCGKILDSGPTVMYNAAVR